MQFRIEASRKLKNKRKREKKGDVGTQHLRNMNVTI